MKDTSRLTRCNLRVETNITRRLKGTGHRLRAAAGVAVIHEVESSACDVVVAVIHGSGDVHSRRAITHVITSTVHASRESVARRSGGATFKHSATTTVSARQ
jgi:hypothetical protein